METINSILGDLSFEEAFGRSPTSDDDEDLRILTHLRHVEQMLRQRDVSGWDPARRGARSTILETLHDYCEAGTFPRNLELPGRRPCFVDTRGSVCAVGYLIEQTLGRETVEAINRDYQYASIEQIDAPLLDEWLADNGITRLEAAMIQPWYGGRTPTPVNGEIFVSSSPTAYERCLFGQAFVPFWFYVATYNTQAQIKGYEGSVAIPAQLIILSESVAGPAPINVGSLGNFIVGAGGCFDGQGIVPLVSYHAGFFIPAPPLQAPICIGPANPSSFSPALPGYLACDGTLVPFGFGQSVIGFPAECGAINPIVDQCTVATEGRSWGSVKAAF